MVDPEYRQRVQGWLEAAREAGGDDGIDLRALSADELHWVGADLEGMAEGVEDAGGVLRGLLDRAPSGDALEDVLIDLKVALDHAWWHWRSAETLLAEHGLWDPELTDPDVGKPPG